MTEYTMANAPEPAVDAYAPPKAKAHKRRNMRRYVMYIICVTTIPCLSFVCACEFNGVQSGGAGSACYPINLNFFKLLWSIMLKTIAAVN